MARRVFEDFRHPTMYSLAYSLCSQINAWHKILLAITVLVLAPIFILTSRHSSSFVTQTSKNEREDTDSFSGLSGNLQYVQETQVVWQISPSPKAVLFIAHGCHCRPIYFWDKSPNCAECVGLPEERILVLHALTKGYAVIAIASTRECWHLGTDKNKVLSILSAWIRDNELTNLPVVGLGASSGGYFISALAREYKFNSLAIMISEGIFKTTQVGANYPPTLFVHMVKDKRRAALVEEAMTMLKSKGVPTTEAKCFPLPVTSEFFTRIPGLDSKTSARVQRALKDTGIVDAENAMTADGRSMNWMMHLKNHQVMPEYSLRLWELHIQELLNLAYGYHEMTSARTDEIFEWFNAHLSKSAV